MRLISAAGQRAIDKVWQEKTSLPLLLLMEAAAWAVVRQARKIAAAKGKKTLPVLILCGRGQNGGDAFAAARLLLAQGWPVCCRELFPGAQLPPEAEANRQALCALGLDLGPPAAKDFSNLAEGLLIDGVFGSGFSEKRQLPQVFEDVCRQVAAAGCPVLAIDVPSGLDASSGRLAKSHIRADWTVTFILPKIGLYAAPGCFAAGEVLVDPLGVSQEQIRAGLSRTGEEPTWLVTKSMLGPKLPIRPPDGHKGTFGRLLLVAGSEQMPGALALAALAAARSGLGLLQLALPQSASGALLAACPEALQLFVNEQSEITDFLPAMRAASGLAVGPGLGRPIWLAPLLDLALAECDRLVIDADALNELGRRPRHYWQLGHKRQEKGLAWPVLTPHPGEFARLAPDLDLADRLAAARELARRSNCVVVLKGAATVIASPVGSCWLNPTGHDGLARGGSGDVLTGLLGGLLVQDLAVETAAVAAVYSHGLAADLLSKKTGRRAMLPSDIIALFSQVFTRLGWEGQND